MFVTMWGAPVLIATAEGINDILAVAETDDRENGQGSCPDVLTKKNLEFDQEFLEVTI